MAMALVHQFCSLPTDPSSSFKIKPQVSVSSVPVSINVIRLRRGIASCPVLKCMADNRSVSDHESSIIARRSANYQPPIWHFDYVQSLESEYNGKPYAERVENLKEEVIRAIFKKLEHDHLTQLKHIDLLQRLGLSYHFEDEVKSILKGIYTNTSYHKTSNNNSLYATALEFRLLRQHGYFVPQEVFTSFKDETGKFMACMSDDPIGLVSLYEASFLMVEGESILEEARDFATKCLEEYIIKKENIDENNDHISLLVSHALELPLQWRMLRLESRWFIDLYERMEDMNPCLLELAKLDFNIVQSTHQEDLKYASRWWRNTGLGQKLEFARDRLMENFLWTVGVVFEPQFGYCRRMSTKVNALITVIDDIYDVYGTLDELELFTDVVDRWDVNDMDQLPDYMKMCFLALHNSINDIAFTVLKEQGLSIVKYLKKVWADICKSYLQEAKWYYSGYTPTLQEYIENAWISISAPVILVHAYFFVTNPITKEGLACLEEYPSIIRQSSILLRLADDLGTSSDEIKRGDVPKSIQCYMHEAGVSEDEARQHIKWLISETWKQMNADRIADSPFSETFTEIATNLARMAQCMYQHGDGHGIQDRETKDRVLSLLVNPISNC
ncbi:Myrcene synthase [Morus notabilis]|uniref:Myrcene synthase n=1 Tax=Morus notabilis TaxID=981085 RepID=W9QPF8_9ROSA|nr:terpene synthase 10 [Morus notabilis]EXB31237.1 Myrcene synthase [Morus notabilis]